MAAYTGQLVKHAERAFEAATARDRSAFNAAMTDLYETYKQVNVTMDTMWLWSRPIDCKFCPVARCSRRGGTDSGHASQTSSSAHSSLALDLPR